MSEAPPSRVLIVRTGAIGDVVNALVVAVALRAARPQTHIGWVAHGLVTPLLEGHPCVDRVHLWRRGSGLAGWRALVRELRSEGYELAIDLQRIAKSALTARASGAPRVLGFDRERCKEGAWLWSTERIAPRATDSGIGHMSDWYLEFANHLGLPTPEPLHQLPASPESEAWAEARVQTLGAPPVLLNLGASKEPNRWPAERFGELAAGLERQAVRGLVWTGGADDAALQQLASACFASAGGQRAPLALAGKTDLLQFAALARRAKLIVTADTGPMHLAAAVGCRVLALFGPANPTRTGPYGANHRVLRAAGEKMSELEVGAVLEHALALSR